MSAETDLRLPDFRNLGVVLRAAVLAEALRLAWSLLQDSSQSAGWLGWVLQGVLFEPVLLSVLLVLVLAAPMRLWLPYRWGVVAVLGLTGLLTWAWQHVFAVWVQPTLQGGGWQNVLAALLVAGAVLFYFNWRHYRLSPAAAQARLMALQARIRPHFLYNSLNSVLALVRADPARAESMLEDLSDLYRALLSDARALVPFEQELALARAYAQIESVRFGRRLRVHWRCDNAPLDVCVPPLMLQPLLENAVRHGVEPREEGADVTVEVYRDGNYLQLFVRNPLPARDGEQPRAGKPGNHMALANIAERLDLHFDAEARLRTYESEGEFVVNIRLPVRSGPRPPGS